MSQGERVKEGSWQGVVSLQSDILLGKTVLTAWWSVLLSAD